MKRCEKYADWITEAALGALEAGRKRELLVHTAECEACRASYWLGYELAVLVDRGVESLVSGEPSAYFLTRLRTCIASDGAPTAAFGWKALGAVALLVAIVVAVIVSHGVRTAQPIDARVGTAPNCASKSGTKEPQARRACSSPAQPEATTMQATMTRPALHQRHSARGLGSPSQPEILVLPGQLGAILQFASAVRSGKIDGQQLLAAQEESEKPLEIAPIEIAPLSPEQPEAPQTLDDGRN